MEGIHGVDVSWLHHSKKGMRMSTIKVPTKPLRLSGTAGNHRLQNSQPAKESALSLTPNRTGHAQKLTSPSLAASAAPTSHEPTHSRNDPEGRHDAPDDSYKNKADAEASHQAHHHLPRPYLSARAGGDRPISPSQVIQKGSKDSKSSPSASRRNSWMSSLSSKFSSNVNATSASAVPSTPPPTKAAQSPYSEASNPFGATVAPGAKDSTKSDDLNNTLSPASPKSGHPSFLTSAFRRLSSGGGATLGKAATTGGVCPRKVMNKDPYRERCEIPDLEPSKLRRVSFCVDVEIAPPAQYSEEEPEEPENPVRRPSLTQLENQIEVKKRKDQKFKRGEGGALKNPQAAAEEKDMEGVIKANGDEVHSQKLVAAGSIEPATKEPSRKKEKKKRSEEERKERRERKRNQALANGDVPRELKKESSSSDAAESHGGAVTPPKSQDRPTTDPLRIYRRCCQLRETPILKRITEQISLPSACPVATPGIISCLDLTGFWMQLPDIITLSDYLAVVPVKKLILENCGLGDEAVRVILAGLLAAKTAEQAKHNKRLSRKACEQIKQGKTENLGVVEKLSFKNNPKIGRDGWRHICLFLYMSKTLKAIDLSGIPLPQPRTDIQNDPKIGMDIPDLLQKALSERPGGSRLEELVMSECNVTVENIEKIVDGVIHCGLTRLGLASNNINFEGLQHILRFIRAGKCEGLDLGGNDLRQLLGPLSDALDEKSSLYALSLADCNLDTATLKILFPALVQLPNFRFIDLSHNRQLFATQPTALDLLRKYLPRFPIIKRIHLQDVAMTSEHAIALAEVLPEIRNLAHLNILENHLLSPLASAKDEASQEEACALYASLMAAVRVSHSIICIDIDVPSADSGEVVKALAKQVVAYSLRNLERLPITEANGSAVAAITDPHGGEKNVTVPDVLLHLVGHVEGFPENHDNDDPAPDDDYIVGGTGVVKALGVCLNKLGEGRRKSRDATSGESGTVTPQAVLQGDEVNTGKAKEMSKNLLGSARKIRARLQPALVREARSGDGMNYSTLCLFLSSWACQSYILIERLQFLDSTLQRMIQRFEDEYPETRLQPPAPHVDTDSTPMSPERIPLGNSFPSDAEEITGANGTLRVPISRHTSDVSLASRQAQEEGRMHRFGQRMRREILRPQTLDHAHGTTGEEEPEAEHLRELRLELENFPGDEIRQKLSELGPEGLFKAIGTTAEELKALGEQDPRIREGRLMELYNIGLKTSGENGEGRSGT